MAAPSPPARSQLHALPFLLAIAPRVDDSGHPSGASSVRETVAATWYVARLSLRQDPRTEVLSITFSRQGNWDSKVKDEDFPGGVVDKNLPAKAADTGLIPGLGTSHML